MKTTFHFAAVNILINNASKIVPVDCASEAAPDSLSMSLRSRLSDTNLRVFEIIPPLVQTDLRRGERARRLAQRGISAEKVAAATLKALHKNRYEAPVGQGRDLRFASRLAPHSFHRLLNGLVSK